MTDLEKDKILLLAHSIGKMARELQSIKGLLKEIADAPQTETQTETQNSNLTFEKRTMRDCYNCKRYETEDECIECHYEPKDECAKEYEELGLKELKELIKADRKTEPQYSEDDMYWLSLAEDVANGKMSDAGANQAWLEYINHKTEPTISKMEQVDKPVDRDDLGNCNICKYVGLEHRCNQCVNGSMFCKIEDEPHMERSE